MRVSAESCPPSPGDPVAVESLQSAPKNGATGLVALPAGSGLWERVFLVAPLVLVGSREGNRYDFAPKHMAMPLGREGFYCFVCSPRHATYANVLAHGAFTVSFPRPEQILTLSLAAGGRDEDDLKPSLAALETVPARAVDGQLVAGCLFYLECRLERVADGFGANSLVIGRVVAASAAADALRAAEADDADVIYRTGALAYLAPGRYAVVRESRSFPYPFDFRP